MKNDDLNCAIKQLRENWRRYERYIRYYDGEHNLVFATEKFKNAFGELFHEFAMNMCTAVCDAVKEKLIVTEFRTEKGGENSAQAAWDLWQANRMEIRSGEVHREAVRCGDAYAIVWPDETGRVTIYPQRAMNCTVRYDDEKPGKIVWSAKYWKTADNRLRMNMYYPDRIERYQSKKGSKDVSPSLDTAGFEQMEDPQPNPYGIVPFFHFANNGDIGSFGTSELRAAIPIQDALNKSVLDMMVAMEFAAYRQRWATGIEIEFDDDGKPIPPYKAGIERLWISESETAKFGDFESSDLEKFLAVKDGFRSDLACVSGTPLYYFMQTGASFPQSGESLKKAETRFINKVKDRMASFGAVWADVMAFALLVENVGRDIKLFTEWEDPAPLSEREDLENILLKKDLGIDTETALMEAGYGEAEIVTIMANREAERQATADAFNAGEEPEVEDDEEQK